MRRCSSHLGAVSGDPADDLIMYRNTIRECDADDAALATWAERVTKSAR